MVISQSRHAAGPGFTLTQLHATPPPSFMPTESKVGILEFRYDHFKSFERRWRETGVYTVNIGDCIQSRAVGLLLERLGQPSASVISVNRDTLAAYQGAPIKLLMNGCFYEACFPLPHQIEPIFIGFQTSSPRLVVKYAEYFKKHSPIGCRDNHTRDLLRNSGIDAYTTGCLSVTLERRQQQPVGGNVFFIGGENAGILPPELKDLAPAQVSAGSIYVHQREEVKTFPLSEEETRKAEGIAGRLLATYRTQASLVVTSLLHAAYPCMAMGIPVILARSDYRDRFTAIDRLLPVHTPANFGTIDWSPQTLELESLKQCLGSLVETLLAGNEPSSEHRRFLANLYEGPPRFPHPHT